MKIVLFSEQNNTYFEEITEKRKRNEGEKFFVYKEQKKIVKINQYKAIYPYLIWEIE